MAIHYSNKYEQSGSGIWQKSPRLNPLGDTIDFISTLLDIVAVPLALGDRIRLLQVSHGNELLHFRWATQDLEGAAATLAMDLVINEDGVDTVLAQNAVTTAAVTGADLYAGQFAGHVTGTEYGHKVNAQGTTPGTSTGRADIDLLVTAAAGNPQAGIVSLYGEWR